MKKICVLGLGYMGLPTALLLASSGYRVVGVDINEKVVESLNNGKIHLKEPGLEELMVKAKGYFEAKREPENADVFLIAVPTPLDHSTKTPELKYVKIAGEMIASFLKPENLVIVESTVPPGTSERIVIPILEKSGLKAGEFYYVYCPERAIPGRTIYEMVHNDRIMGALDKTSANMAKEIYSSFVRGNIYLTDIRTAEFVKLIENIYRDVNIALANEFAQIAEELGINVWEAIELANKHPRVNILKPGPGVGGHCIPLDSYFLAAVFPNPRLLLTAREINELMPNYTLKKVKELVKDIKEPTITVLGVAYKGNVDDARESPALKFIRLAENEGFKVRVFDPYVKSFEYPLLSLEDAVKDSDCIVVITDHDLFKNLEPEKIGKLMRNRNVFDGRNILKHEEWQKAGFKVKVLGYGSKL